MKPMKLLFSLSLIVVLAACNLPGGAAPTEDIAGTLEAARTQAVQTAIASLPTVVISTPVQLPTNTPAVHSPTPPPTATPTQLAPTATPPAATPTAAATLDSAKLSIAIVGVDKNRVITVQAQDFPANQTFKIRVGPFVGFFKNFVETGTINSGNGGNFKFNVNLPSEVRDVDKITVRLDSTSTGVYAYNVFTNTTSGSIAATATPSTTTTPGAGTACQVSVSPSASQTLKTREDFDAVWTVKNTSNRTWEAASVDYKYTSGTEMQKFAKAFDLKQSVKSGESIKITVDMLTPDKAGTYTTIWSIVEGSTVLCSLPLTVTVK